MIDGCWHIAMGLGFEGPSNFGFLFEVDGCELLMNWNYNSVAIFEAKQQEGTGSGAQFGFKLASKMAAR